MRHLTTLSSLIAGVLLHAVIYIPPFVSTALVLMDLQMPEMDGFEATSMIRSGKANCHPQIPILVLTADTTSKTRKEIFRLGANELMTKPINGALLFSKMKKNIPEKPYVA